MNVGRKGSKDLGRGVNLKALEGVKAPCRNTSRKQRRIK
jgi:hypothetical protein